MDFTEYRQDHGSTNPCIICRPSEFSSCMSMLERGKICKSAAARIFHPTPTSLTTFTHSTNYEFPYLLPWMARGFMPYKLLHIQSGVQILSATITLSFSVWSISHRFSCGGNFSGDATLLWCHQVDCPKIVYSSHSYQELRSSSISPRHARLGITTRNVNLLGRCHRGSGFKAGSSSSGEVTPSHLKLFHGFQF